MAMPSTSLLPPLRHKNPLRKDIVVLTFTELILNICVWVLTAAGLFFGIRAALRRRKQRKRRDLHDD